MRAWLFVATAVLTGCSPRVQVSVDVYTDLVAYEEFDVIRLAVGGTTRDVAVRPGDVFVPGALRQSGFTVAPGEVVDIDVALLTRARTTLSRRVRLRITEGGVVPVWLLRSCLSVRCPGADPAATECDDGRCVPPECDTPECMGGGCGTGCPPPLASCAEAQCLEGRCSVVPVDGACPPTQYCAPDSGCLTRTAAITDAGMDGGASDAGTDAASDAPLGECRDRAGCPPMETSAWSGCSYPDACAESAPDETRTVSDFACEAGRCVRHDTVEPRACARATTGLVCAPPDVGPWSECVYGVVCPITGVRDRSVTNHACAGGTCAASVTIERDSSPASCPPFTEVCDLFDNDCDGACDPGCRTAISRSYRDSSASHLFTYVASEASCCEFVVEDADAFYLYGSNVGGALVPLNRCYSPSTNHHIYGTSGCEGVADAVFEFPLGYLSTIPFCGSVPLTRLTDGTRNLLTIEAAEVAALTSMGWTSHGVIGHVWPN